jgi:hypothetical protein
MPVSITVRQKKAQHTANSIPAVTIGAKSRQQQRYLSSRPTGPAKRPQITPDPGKHEQCNLMSPSSLHATACQCVNITSVESCAHLWNNSFCNDLKQHSSAKTWVCARVVRLRSIRNLREHFIVVCQLAGEGTWSPLLCLAPHSRSRPSACSTELHSITPEIDVGTLCYV